MTNAGDTPSSGYTSRPVPDPTELTTAALYREVAALKELIEQRVSALDTSNESKHAAIRDTVREAIEARNILDREVQLRTDLQFRLAEQQRIEQKADTRNAVDAALTAQKEAIGKTEASTNKALDELGKRFDTQGENLRRSIDENKERIIDIDRGLRAAVSEVDRKASDLASQKIGATTDRAGLYAGLAALGGLILLGIAVAAVFAAKGG